MFSIDERTALRLLRNDDAPELFALTEANRRYLRRWLPWLDAVETEADTLDFIATVNEQREAGRGPTFAIVVDGVLGGIVGFHPIETLNGVGCIGYWLAEPLQGRGIMTECCRFLVRYGFETLNLNRIEIPVATGNARSRAIPERLGFRLEGVLRAREWLYGTYVDHAMYSLLRDDSAAVAARPGV